MCTKAPREPNKPESKMFRNKTLSVPHENRGRFLNEGAVGSLVGGEAAWSQGLLFRRSSGLKLPDP